MYRFPVSTPRTKEEYMYRDIFSKHFPAPAAAATVPQVCTRYSTVHESSIYFVK